MLHERVVAAKALADACAFREYAVQLHGDVCVLESAGLDVTVQDVQRAERNADIVSVLYSAGRKQSAFPAIPVVCTGAASDLPVGTRETAEQWLDFAFPTLHSVFADHEPTLGVTIGKLTSVIIATGQPFEWRVHVGPIYTRIYGDGHGVPEPEPTELVRHVVGALAGVSAHTDGFAADLYVARDSEGQITTDCRLNNNPWQEATHALRQAPESWPPFQATIVSKRQLLFFQPALPSAPAPSEATARAAKPGLWRRLFGR